MVTLDKVLKEKVEPMVKKSMKEILGITISDFDKDISDKIEKNPLIAYHIDPSVKFKSAKKLFKKQFLTRMLQVNFGNVSNVAKKTGLDRRSIHRAVKELDIDVKNIRKDVINANIHRKEAVEEILKAKLDDYKQIIKPSRLGKMYDTVDKLSTNIIKELPAIEMSWDDAEKLFEKEYFDKALEENDGNVSLTAKKIGLRYETLHRKLKKLR